MQGQITHSAEKSQRNLSALNVLIGSVLGLVVAVIGITLGRQKEYAAPLQF